MSKCRMWTKNHKREKEIWFEQIIMPRMNYKWNVLVQTFRKNIQFKKNDKRKYSEIASRE